MVWAMVKAWKINSITSKYSESLLRSILMYRKRHKQGTIWLCNNLLTNKIAAGLTQIYHNKSRRWKPPIVMCLRHDIWAFVLAHNLIFAWIHEKIKAKIKLYKDITTKYKFCISINIPYKNIYNVTANLMCNVKTSIHFCKKESNWFQIPNTSFLGF